MANEYSTIWFDTFLAPISSEQTTRETDFLVRQLPQPQYQNVLDLCCGMGRHTRQLSKLGYRVIGVDTSAFALEQAAQQDARSRYQVGDMRDLREFQGLDGILILWQSFGNFDTATNAQIVRQITDALTRRGRFILDIYNRYFFETHLGERRIEIGGRTITETKTLHDNRLRVVLNYGTSRDVYEWQIFYPDEISLFAARFGLNEILRCTKFDESTPPTRELPRMQFVFEKTR